MTDIRETLRDVIREHRNAGRSSDEIAAAVLALVGPKPLVWLVLGDGNPRDIYSSLSIAASPYGPYFIGHSPKSGDQYCWSGPCNSGGRWFPTLAAAQAAAQAHADAAHWANTKLGDLIGKEPKT